MAENYQKKLDAELERIAGYDRKPRLLLHVCCAPCSSYVLEYLSYYFDITACFYNPNIAVTASLVKAMLINSAVRMFGYCEQTQCVDFTSSKPNVYQGFGRIQLNR